jgi:Phosphate-selective porin O and P
MATKSLKWLALLSGVTLAASVAVAQDSGALLDALVRKGVLNDQEAEEIRADLTRDNAAAMPKFAAPAGKDTKSIAISGRIQTQYFSFDNDNIADSSGFIMRRIYLGAKAKVGADWTADFNYNFADGEVDKAILQWGGDVLGQDATIDIGFRKVNFGMEETTSSASLKAIERSPVTRFFVEGDFGDTLASGPGIPGAATNPSDRELGAASRRIGLFFNFNDVARSGKESGLYYGFAITNPDRQGPSLGDRRGGFNNTPALWADVGYSYKTDSVSGKFGAAVSHIREGFAFDAPVADATLTGFSVYNDITFGKLNIAAEFMTADLKDGAVVAAVVEDANPYGYWIQPSFMVTDKFELVARYSFVDGDGRGLRLRDLVRRSDGTITGDELTEYYIGMNYYFVGNSVKLQLGYIIGEVEIDGGASEKTKGIRSQIQVLF